MTDQMKPQCTNNPKLCDMKHNTKVFQIMSNSKNDTTAERLTPRAVHRYITTQPSKKKIQKLPKFNPL